MAVGVLIAASSCDPKPNHETQLSSKADSVVVKSDSTLSTEASQDSLQSK